MDFAYITAFAEQRQQGSVTVTIDDSPQGLTPELFDAMFGGVDIDG
jgi:hypothetical protein